MRNYFYVAIFAIAICIFSACEKQVLDVVDSDEMYTVQLGWSGDLDVTYEAMTKSHDTENLYGIQVYSCPLIAHETVWTPYAHGIFGSTDDLSVSLLKGYKYRFVATMVVDGKTKVFSYENGYYFPFFVGGTNNAFPVLNNTFNYTSTDFMDCLKNGKTTLSNRKEYLVPNTERYYGELDDFVPSKHNAKAKIHMKRVAFGAKFIVKGKLAESGTVVAQIDNAPELSINLKERDKQVSDKFTFVNVKTAWEDNSFRENYNVYLSWVKDNGVTVPLGTHSIEFKRNATTVVHINIDEDGFCGGLGIEYDEIGNMETGHEVVIQDGEIVDTELDTNC